jgi:DNA (cytosine-5)-methyltransferase 1
MKVLDLFSGIGGFSLGLERAGMETVAFCEQDKYCQQVLRKHWPDVPIYDDVRELNGSAIGHVDLICGGFPCQPFSTAGKRAGKDDDRHLWPEFARLISEIHPRWVIGENVSGLISMGLDEVLSDLEGQGYAAEAFVIPACAVDAPHRRDRVWIIGNGNGNGKPTVALNDEAPRMPETGADSDSDSGKRLKPCQPYEEERQEQRMGQAGSLGNGARWRETQPDVCGMDDGLSRRMDRLRALGNAVVPQIPEIIGRAILSHKTLTE